MVTINKAMEDWFLRGGEKPQINGMLKVSRNLVCQNCGGENLADEEYCTHCGAALTGGTSTEESCGSEHGENPCDECDGRTRCDDCPHNCDDDEGYDACEECEDHSMCAKCHHVEGEPDDGEKAEYTVAVKYWRKVRYEAFVDVEADNPADAVAQAREMYEDMDLDPEEIDSEDFGEPEFEVDP